MTKRNDSSSMTIAVIVIGLLLFVSALKSGCSSVTPQQQYQNDVQEIKKLRTEREAWEKGWRDAQDKVERDTRPDN